MIKWLYNLFRMLIYNLGHQKKKKKNKSEQINWKTPRGSNDMSFDRSQRK